jgi:glucokinase
MQAKNPVLAMDIGGTKIATALISRDSKILAQEYSLAMAYEGVQPVISRIFTAIDSILSSRRMTVPELAAMSIACAGGIDSENGIVSQSPNLPGWRNVPLRNIITERYKVNTFLLNDANAAAIGEHRLGAGRGTRNLFYMTVSTGIGGGIIIENRLYAGASGVAGEIGHMTVDPNGPKCSCGNFGCLERMVSGKAVATDAIKRIREGAKSSLVGIEKGKIDDITAEKVSKAAYDGDSLALEIIARAANYLGTGVVNLVNLLNPEIVVIGGGLSKIGDLLFNPVREAVKERAFELASQIVHIVPAELGDDAGVLGAALFAFDEERA